jgi:hypothetical protein
MLTAEQLSAREGKITGSQMNILMSGNEARILNLWRELVGDPKYVPDDLSKVWPVRLGEATEALNLEWYAMKHGPVTRMGEVVVRGWMGCTLDGWNEKEGFPVEAKCVGGRFSMADIVARYAPQTHWQMIVTETRKCALSVIIGGAEPVVEVIPYNHEYAALLRATGRNFLDLVENLIPPSEILKIEPPPLPVKEYDMVGSNAWANFAPCWLQTRVAALQNADAEKEIKALVPKDAAKAFGHGIIVTRNRAGAMRLTEMK